jgi:hypothetical protein
MKDHARSLSRLMSVFVLTLTLTGSFAYFAPGDRLRAVSAQSISPIGSFGFVLNATYPDPSSNSGAALFGVMNFDGAGSVDGSGAFINGATGGQVAQTVSGTFTGTYSSNPDGTGAVTMDLGDGLILKLTMVITDGGESLQFVATGCTFPCGATLFSGVARLTRAVLLKGAYGFQLNNSVLAGGTIGVIGFDGAGNATLSFTSTGAGVTGGQPIVMTGTQTGTYSVSPDGSGTANFAAAPGQSANSTFAFAITDGGSGLLLLQTNGPAGVPFGTARLQ